MGAFAHYLGIRPWEWDLLSYTEASDLMRFVDALNKRGA